jgi:mono/diheme cytochrome c family protein
MRHLTSLATGRALWVGLLSIASITAGAVIGCGDTPQTQTGPGGGGTGGTTTTNPTTGGAAGGTTTTPEGGGGSTTTTPEGGGGTGGTTTTTSTTKVYECKQTAPGETRGSAVALSPKDDVLVVANRDVGTVTVFHVDYASGSPAMNKVSELTVGAPDSEPWQVAIDACGSRAYVVLRKEQKVVELVDVDTNDPAVGASVAVGSEPTGIAITPNNKQLYVTNWVDGTVNAITTSDMKIVSTVDLNAAIAATGDLGKVTPRPALAHPRAIAITNNGDASDADETIFVTEWFALRTAPDSLNGVTIDTNWKGIVYKLGVDSSTVSTVDLPPVMDTGFKDHNGAATGCFPNQVGSITIKGGFAYVTSTCASPKGPLGVFQKGTCTSNAQCGAGTCNNGLCTLSCVTDADCGFGAPAGSCNVGAGGTCGPNPNDVKTTTHPAMTVFDVASGAGTTTVLDQQFNALQPPNGAPTVRMPHLPSDVSFFNSFAYVSAMGADALFRITVSNGSLTAFGAGAGKEFINLRKDATDKTIRNPIGVATTHDAAKAFAFVANDGARNVATVNLAAQALLEDTPATALPLANTEQDKVLRGKRFFNTGLGRWSHQGLAWGSCAACHMDGLSDNVTWYFNRGPRQSVSLDGSFASKDPKDQRIFNWTAIFDEVADFEGNVRGVSGGVGAIVSANSTPPVNADRINTAAETPPQQGLQGSSADTASPSGIGAHPHSVIDDWSDITEYIRSIRSPRRPTNLDPAKVAAGKALFSGTGNCVGCHGGAKWTISKVFWDVGDKANDTTNSALPTSLGTTDWFKGQNLNGFPASLFPVADTTNARMRFGAPPGAEQMQCILRPVGTIKSGADTTSVSPAEVGVLELRQDMVTKGQGAADTGRGFNPPSLLGMQVGAPYFHAGNARTLEELFADNAAVSFKGHYQTQIAAVFDPNLGQSVDAIVQYLLSIDEDEPTFAIPAKGNTGGDLCFAPPMQ